jgi:uncharacterized protein (TIGR02145 family)
MVAGAQSPAVFYSIGASIAPIKHTTTNATGIGVATGLPAGLTADWAGNTITISGTPTTDGTFNYTIPLTGGCGNINATGSITVVRCSANVSGTVRTFLCHNLGANTTINPFTTTPAVGHLYQWGRKTDGHQVPTSATTTTLATNSDATLPADVVGKFIIVTSGTTDWLTPQVNTLWNGTTKGVNDPCPAGFRVPSQGEWGGIYKGGIQGGLHGASDYNNISGVAGTHIKVGNNLVLPFYNIRNGTNGNFDGLNRCNYWSSTASGGNARVLHSSDASIFPNNTVPRTYGSAVRCIAE